MCCPALQGVDGGTITLHTKTLPKEIRMWHATTLDGKRRDFRLITGPEPTPHPVFWFEGKVEQASHWSLASAHWHHCCTSMPPPPPHRSTTTPLWHLNQCQTLDGLHSSSRWVPQACLGDHSIILPPALLAVHAHITTGYPPSPQQHVPGNDHTGQHRPRTVPLSRLPRTGLQRDPPLAVLLLVHGCTGSRAGALRLLYV